MSVRRPPLVLSEPEPDVADPSQPGVEATAAEISPLPAPDDPTPETSTDRPMSERRRRRLAEEARVAAEAQAAERERAAREAEELAQFRMASEGGLPATVSDALPVTLADDAPATRGPAYLIAALALVLWIGGLAAWLAYEIGAGGTMDPLRIAVFALVALAPAGLALLLAHSVRQGARLHDEARRTRGMADALAGPALLAARQTGQVVTALRDDIDRAGVAAEKARSELAALREALAEESRRLSEAADAAARTARSLNESMGAARGQLEATSVALSAQGTGVVEAVERQSRMVADASDLANAQLRESEAALAARAADLAAAAQEAQEAARLAADDLARQTLRLETAGTGVAEQIHAVEEGLGQQRAALVTTAYQLRTDQEDFSAQVESQRAQLIEQLSASRSAGAALDDTVRASGDSIKELIEAATDQFRALTELSQKEADGFDLATKQALDRFEALAADTRDALLDETRRAVEMMNATAEESRALADEAQTQARIRIDRLGESLFEAAQKADSAADARIEGARRIVAETAALVDEAGERAAERLTATAERLSEVLGEVDRLTGEIDARAAALPDESRARLDAVRATVSEGLEAVADATRRAAQDTETLELAFQDRVRRNYEMLSEAVRLMGVVSGDGPQASPRDRDELARRPLREAARSEDAGLDAPTPEATRPTSANPFNGLRGRLRLSPADDPQPAPARPAIPDDEPLTLRPRRGVDIEQPLELEEEAQTAGSPFDPDRAQAVVQTIRRMGVDPNALLPRARVEEAATALGAGDVAQARAIVRRVAPAAVRSVSRRVLADGGLKADIETFVRAAGAEMADLAGRGDDDGLTQRLSSDAGRAWLLLDAAVGDLA
ncbi:tipN [Brevundimonas lutea]|uniref:tipN n=1 Tax=Brevundimonas lutea TaxID=2293980 RepID=UPI000F016FF5|nr:tipN [Brevundimonas lutea]